MYKQRMNHCVIENSIETKYITALLGPRRVGKSYFLDNYAKHHPERKWVFLNMDQMEQRKRVSDMQLASMISESAKQQINGKEKIWVVVDEVQKCPDIFDQIKIMYDENKDKNNIKFILTGSAVLSLHQFSAESLAGRIELHHLQAFNLREATLTKENSVPMDSILDLLTKEENSNLISEHIAHLKPFKPELEKELSQLLIWGGFPELLAITTTQEKISYLNNYLQTYLEKDVRAIETITDLNLYRNMLDVLAEQTGSVRDDQRIIEALGCTRDTLKKYRGYVEATLLFMEVYPFINSALKRLVKSPKGYLLNNGLVSLLTGLWDLDVLQKSGLIGHRLENWFLNELNTWISRSPLRQHINYWRTSSGTEVDFVVTRKPHILPFEITYGRTIDNKKIRNLKTFMQIEPKAPWGYYIYRGDFAIDEKKKIMFIPCWAVG